MRISDWSSDVCSSDLFGRAGGSERDAPGSLTTDIQRLGGKARRFDAPGADHLNARVARLPRHTDAPPASDVDYQMIERDAPAAQVAVAGQAEFAAHALPYAHPKSAIALHHQPAEN